MAASAPSAGAGLVLLLAYAAGLAIPFIAVLIALRRFRRLAGWLGERRRIIDVVTGTLVAGVGVLVFTGSFMIGLQQLDLPLAQAAAIAGLCAEGKCDQVSRDLRRALATKRAEIGRRVGELQFLDRHLAHLVGQLNAGEPPRPLITLGKEERHAS